MMYEETCNIPFILRHPGGPKGVVSESLVSHLDIIPTMLDIAGIEQPEILTGKSLLPVLADPKASVRDYAMVNFHRFAVNFDAIGGFYPIRCLTDGRYKLIINLFETDELYDLQVDPYEMNNVIHDPTYCEIRDKLHDRLLDWMDEIRDPFRSFAWGRRQWREACPEYYGEETGNRPRPRGFPFQAA